jgi:hypothetical protein
MKRYLWKAEMGTTLLADLGRSQYGLLKQLSKSGIYYRLVTP